MVITDQASLQDRYGKSIALMSFLSTKQLQQRRASLFMCFVETLKKYFSVKSFIFITMYSTSMHYAITISSS